jgi:ABC-type cobalamin/Fe3+-siderophores transport system ATPase subunit
MESPELTRAVTYALSAALRRRDFFELHSAAVIDPVSEAGALIIGPSGSGKSTLTVQLATAGWSFLTDDVLLLGLQNKRVKAWPLRRSFAITATTYASSSFLQSRSSLDYLQQEFDGRENDKRRFAPETVFDASFNDSCIPEALFFTQLGNGERSQVMRLSTAETMSRLIRMNPWSCYDRATAANHLATLSALATQSSGYSLVANRDLLDPQLAAKLIRSHLRSERKS